MEMRIFRGGMLTTVQDLGRRGFRAAGVPLSGAMDPLALRVANSIVGNLEGAAALEISLVGPELDFTEDAIIALAGAECEGMSSWKPLRLRAGERLRLGACLRGCRSYLAVAGGIAVEPVLGSRSTYLRAGIGGFRGRALREGDVLPVGIATRVSANLSAGTQSGLSPEMLSWRIDPRILPLYSNSPVVRVLPGAQEGEFDRTLFESEFRVSPQSDRMGLRLLGPAVARRSALDLLSSALLPGTVQIPPDGQPLLLMADAQTIGGYPQIAHVISVDLPLVAQLRPGDTIRFAPVSLSDAHRLVVQRDRAVAILREGLAGKLDRLTSG